MCAVWQVPNTVAGPWGLYFPFSSFIISPPVQPGTKSGVSAERLDT